MLLYSQMRIDILTLFPTMFCGALQESMLKRAQQRGLLHLIIHQIRDYALDRHQMTDDVPYGGGVGMVMKPEPVFRAVRTVLGGTQAPVILLTPQGRTFTHAVAQELAQHPRLVLICGHYEGVDERVRECIVTDELSIGDYVLTGGELAAMVVVDAVARFVAGGAGGRRRLARRLFQRWSSGRSAVHAPAGFRRPAGSGGSAVGRSCPDCAVETRDGVAADADAASRAFGDGVPMRR